ncbi:hypothetical protein [Nocardioides speluncae]|uniref:hypothetical protein n=1 Tax=Nocardioides speluncae TaxID=2670337 RepID=UPI000D68B998|nr:hypothetical protein [Nocardioides speluncae]
MLRLVIRRSGGEWAVTDGDATLATARGGMLSDRLEIHHNGRVLRADLSKGALVVTDSATGEQVVRAAHIPGRDPQVAVREKWAVSFATGAELAWMYKSEPRQMGFYDAAANPVMVIGHHISIQAPRKASVVRILFRMWTGAVKSAGEYGAVFDEPALAALSLTSDAPLLALLGMTLERRWQEGSTESAVY